MNLSTKFPKNCRAKNGQKRAKIAQNACLILSTEFSERFGAVFLSKTGRKNLHFMIRNSRPSEFYSLYFYQLTIKSEFTFRQYFREVFSLRGKNKALPVRAGLYRGGRELSLLSILCNHAIIKLCYYALICTANRSAQPLQSEHPAQQRRKEARRSYYCDLHKSLPFLLVSYHFAALGENNRESGRERQHSISAAVQKRRGAFCAFSLSAVSL